MSGRAEHPAVSRWRVRHALRHARDAKGLTQTEVATAMEWSLSKVQRIELGEVNIASTDLRSVLELLDITDPDTVSGLLDEARVSRRERYVVDADLREHLTPSTLQMLQFAAVADAAQWFLTYVIPGFLQTPAYTEAVLRFLEPRIADDKLKAHLDSRAQWRRDTTDSGDPPELEVVIYEPLLMMNVGGAEIMAEQLRELVVSARRGNLKLRVLPMESGLMTGFGSFGLLRLDRGLYSGEVLYRELAETDSLVDDLEVLELHRDVFVRTWASSLPEEKSVKRIIAEAAALDAQ
ncbi:helix-turn-helix domain-containing protein [Actinoplanes sp. NPDC049265]|uniref:helix-turn-helix domain-containing protein n=1 Tax=Actinoplanes sp. NPDC049265 TaxID=3363902 RepID=UPI0037157510